MGEPWNQQAVFKGIGVPAITDYQLWKNNPEKVFGITAEFAEQYPNTTLVVTKALIRAAILLDENDNANRPEAGEILSRPEYVGADYDLIANSKTGFFEFEKGDKRDIPDFNVFFRYRATDPFYSDAVWYLTQMCRWGQFAKPKTDAWYDEVAQMVYRPDLYLVVAATDPVSRQPESKANVVKVTRLQAAWYGFAVPAAQVLPNSDYWALFKTVSVMRAELAGLTRVAVWESEARRLFNEPDARAACLGFCWRRNWSRIRGTACFCTVGTGGIPRSAKGSRTWEFRWCARRKRARRRWSPIASPTFRLNWSIPRCFDCWTCATLWACEPVSTPCAAC